MEIQSYKLLLNGNSNNYKLCTLCVSCNIHVPFFQSREIAWTNVYVIFEFIKYQLTIYTQLENVVKI